MTVSSPTPRALLVGLRPGCRQLEQQLALLDDRPEIIGWLIRDTEAAREGEPVLGGLDRLEVVIARNRPDLVLITLPATMKELIFDLRTRVRRLGVPDRFMPTLDDQLAGVGPRTNIDVDVTALLDRSPRRIDPSAIQEVIRSRRVLITGAGGSIGSELARIAAKYAPSELMLVDRSENALFEIDRQIARFYPDLQRRVLLHDVVDAEGTLAHFQRLQPEVIFHAAAHKHVPMMEEHPAAAVDNNLFGTKSVFDAADAVGAHRCVMISTDKAVRPSSIMGATKRLAELYVQHRSRTAQTGFSMVRFGNVLGSSGSVIETWTRQIADGGPVTVTHPEMTRYLMTIPEAASLVIQSASLMEASSPEGTTGEVFVLDMGEPLKIVDLAQRLVELHGLVAVFPDDTLPTGGSGTVRIVFTAARPGEKLHEELAFEPHTMRHTEHPDINIWILPAPSDAFMAKMLGALARGNRPRNQAALASQIRDLVPEMVEPVAV